LHGHVDREDFPYFGVELVTGGQGTVSWGGRSYQLSRGVAFAYAPRQKHRIENTPPGGMSKYYLDLAGAEAEERIRDAGPLEGSPILLSNIPELTGLLDAIDLEARGNSRTSLEICQLFANILLMKICERRIASNANVPSSFHTFEAVYRCIEERFLSVSTVDEIANAGGISPIYLARLFKRYSSTGAYQFLMRLRMNYAAELLVHEGLMVQQVAMRLGYNDQYQFSRAFKRVYGVPPSSLRSRK
jgi:AraC-like DNA-binding protein